ncbi:MAG: hypothetical protein ACTSYD_03890 [Candidatus Heimdallarchaeaceae archaeon]
MAEANAELVARHFIKLLDKKNVWDLDQLCSILNIESIEFAFFVKSLPMAYGLSLAKHRIYVTHELVKDAKNEIAKLFQEWLETTQPIESQKFEIEELDNEHQLRGKIAKIPKRKAKISVYGDRELLKKALESFIDVSSVFSSFVGGYTPADGVVADEIEPVECQFLILNSQFKKYVNAFPVITQLVQGFLLIYDPKDKLQYQSIKELTTELIKHRTKEITCAFIAFMEKEPTDLELECYLRDLRDLALSLADEPIFHVSFSITHNRGELKRKITELVHLASSFLGLEEE